MLFHRLRHETAQRIFDAVPSELCTLLWRVAHGQPRLDLRVGIYEDEANIILRKLHAAGESYQPGNQARDWTFTSEGAHFWLFGGSVRVRAHLLPTDTIDYNGTNIVFCIRYGGSMGGKGWMIKRVSCG